MNIEKYANDTNTILTASDERDDYTKDTLKRGSYTINKIKGLSLDIIHGDQ